MRTTSTGSAFGSATPAGGERQAVVLREQARRDIDEAVEHYLTEAGPAVALHFIDALEDSRRQIGEQPASGSPRYVHELDIPSPRFRSAGRFPYLSFHVEREVDINVWRVPHEARDIPAWMRETRGE